MSAPGELIAGRYRLRRQVGAGGMGVVWEAFDERLHRRVAVKQLHPQPWLDDAEADLATERAMREARITARLHHAHAVPVYDVVEDQHRPCLVMQFLPSEPLSSVLHRRGTLPEPEIAELGRQLASALQAAHQVGIVHRDVKPGNVLVAEDGTARISDFGIAHALGDVTLTSTGIVAGTVEYLAPEVARGRESGFAADVFSLGATLYAASQGRPPFGTDSNRVALLHRVAAGVIDPPTRSGALTSLLVDLLAVDPAERPTMSQVADRLTSLGTPREAPPSSAAGLPTESTTLPPTAGIRGRPLAATTATPARALTSGRGSTQPHAATVLHNGPGSADGDLAPHGSVRGAAPRVVPPAPPGPPPARPTGRHAAPSRRPRPTGARVLAVLVAVLLVVTPLALLLQSRSDSIEGRALASPASPGATGPPAPSSGPTTPGATAPSTPTPPTSAASPTSPPASPPATASAPTGAAAGALTAADAAQTVTSYYSLLPANTDAAWPLLTASYQANKAGGHQSYQQFWNTYSRVTSTDVTAVGPSTVEAMIGYYFKDGRVVRERTSFGLVNDAGVVKIDSSRILSIVAR